jgi:hypothetical protein
MEHQRSDKHDPLFADAKPVKSVPGDPLPQVLDPVVTMGIVQKYVEFERNRSRRVLLWTSTIFMFVCLLILVVFISIGTFVLRNARQAADIATDVQQRTALYSAEVIGVSNLLSRMETRQTDIRKTVDQSELRRRAESAALQRDLVRFSQWVAARKGPETGDVAQFQSRVALLDEEIRKRDRDLQFLMRKYEELAASVSNRLAAGASVAAEPSPAPTGPVVTPVASVASPPGPGRPAVPKPAEETGGEIETPVPRKPVGPVTVVKLPTGGRYEGEVKDGIFSGWGILVEPNGDRYEGEFDHDMRNGKGTLVEAKGDTYVGDFRNDLREGRGSLTTAAGDRYVGEFRGGLMDGKGTVFYKNGNKYVGEMKNGVREGRGVLKFYNGDVYEGDFLGDRRTGKGVYMFADGARYVGDFKSDRREGEGRYLYASGEEYVGGFKDGRKEGRGVLIYPDGKRLSGLWREDNFVSSM